MQNNCFPIRAARPWSGCSLIEQSQCSGLKRFAASTTGIIPGNRGKAGDSWCHPPLPRGNACGRQISPAPLAGFVTGPVQHESGAERRGAMRNRVRAESGPQDVSTCGLTQLPRGLWLLLRGPERSRASRRATPAKRPGSERDGARKGGVAARSERAWQSPSTSSNGAVGKNRITLLQGERNLRVKRSDP